jgi:choline dehydrogenase-like flavoprotein
MRPLSRGYVEAKPNRLGDAPAINPRYLSEETGRRAIIGTLRLARRISAHPRSSRSSAKKACRARSSRPTTNCSTTRGATAAPATTPAAPA